MLRCCCEIAEFAGVGGGDVEGHTSIGTPERTSRSPTGMTTRKTSATAKTTTTATTTADPFGMTTKGKGNSKDEMRGFFAPLRMTDIFLWSFCDSEADEGCYCCAANRQVAVPSNNVSMQRRDACGPFYSSLICWTLCPAKLCIAEMIFLWH